eukprot:100857_1
MTRFKLPGSSLLDRCIGRSSFEYTHAIKINPFPHNLSYDSYIKTLSKYQPTKYTSSWTYTTPFGRQNTCRLNLGSSKRMICLHSYINTQPGSDTNDPPTQMEIYEYCTGSIRSSLFTVLSTQLLPSRVIDGLVNTQYRLACFFADKLPHSLPDHLFDAMYRAKLMDAKTFTSTQPNLFPKWCSSISLVRVLKAKHIDVDALINKSNTLKGQSNINISKDIDHDIKKQEDDHEAHVMYRMKHEHQSDILRNYKQLTEFDRNYSCDEMYLVHSTRYALSSSSFIRKLLFLPHWITVRWLAQARHEYILTDLANNLDFVSKKHSESDSNESSRWHKEKPRKI